MSIRALALDLYKAQKNVDGLQKRLDEAAPVEKDALAQEMRLARQELQILRKMLDGEKESGEFRKRFSGFGGFKP